MPARRTGVGQLLIVAEGGLERPPVVLVDLLDWVVDRASQTLPVRSSSELRCALQRKARTTVRRALPLSVDGPPAAGRDGGAGPAGVRAQRADALTATLIHLLACQAVDGSTAPHIRQMMLMWVAYVRRATALAGLPDTEPVAVGVGTGAEECSACAPLPGH